MSEIKQGALVYYKSKAAIVTGVSDKIDILFFKTKKRVRDKDIKLLHPGVIRDVSDLDKDVPESLDTLDEVLELLAGETVSLEDLADYLYGEFTPQTAWSSWMLVVDGLYFEGDTDAITPRPLALINTEKEKRETKKTQKEAWDGLITRIKTGKIVTEDYTHLVEVEQLACEERENSRILKTIGINETKEDAHRLLLRLGYWKEEYNPWPRRFKVDMNDPVLAIPETVESERRDLQHLQAWAIDDVGNQDPDDAISLDGDRVWVHIADASSLIMPDSEMDIEARSRGTNLYLPNKTVHMLPQGITEQLGLGLQQQSPALSIGFTVTENGALDKIEVCFSQVKVSRMTYNDADQLLESQFADLVAITERYHQYRLSNDATNLDLPQVNIRVKDGKVTIEPYPQTGSRQLVSECMLAAGEAVSRFANEHDIPIPYAYQPPPEERQDPKKLSEHYTYRRFFKPSRHATEPAPHFGLGILSYTRVTSPLRRYLDLVVHQQLRAFLTGQPLLEYAALVERIGLADEATFASRKTERFSNQHWKMLYLKQQGQWQGEAIAVAENDRNITFIVPTLALEPRIRSKKAARLDEPVNVQVTSIDIPNGQANFRLV